MPVCGTYVKISLEVQAQVGKKHPSCLNTQIRFKSTSKQLQGLKNGTEWKSISWTGALHKVPTKQNHISTIHCGNFPVLSNP